MERSIEAKTNWKLVKCEANLKNQTVTSRVNFHLAKLKKLLLRGFNAKISASCQWIFVTHSGSYKLDKSVLSIASRISCYIIVTVTCYNNKKKVLKLLKGTGSRFSACSFIKMLFFCRDILYPLSKQHDHVIMLSKNQSAHSRGSHLHLISLNIWK